MELAIQLAAIKQELNDKLPHFMNQSLDKVGFRIVKFIPKQQLDQLRQDLAFEEKERKSEFLAMFPSAFLTLLHKLLDQQNAKSLGLTTKPPEPRNVSELFGQSFFPSDIAVFRKHSVLETIVQDMNQSIHKFYMLKKGKLQELIQLQKDIENQAIPSNIQKFIKKDQEKKTHNSFNKQEEKQHNFSKRENREIKEIKEIQISQNSNKNQDVIPIEIKKENNRLCVQCLCSRTTLNVVSFNQSTQSQQIQCRICDGSYHTICLRITNPNPRQFICPDCILLKMDLLHSVVEILCDAVPFHPTNHAALKTLTFTLKQKVPNQAIDVRCIKIDGKMNSEEPTWPDIGELTLNGRRVFEFKPLQCNSSLKKRKDEKFTTQDVLYNAQNTIVIKEGQPTQDQKMNCRVQLGQVYYLGVYLVRRLSHEGLVKEIKENQENWLSMQNSKQFIQLYVKQTGTDDVSIESLQVSFICQFDTRLMETPVRGLLCEHLQCFSLENMIKMMGTVFPRRWRCPICKSKCVGLQIDGYQSIILNLINRNKLDIEEITFDKKGELVQSNLKEILDAPETIKLFPNYMIQNSNRVFSMESLEKKIEQPMTIKNELVKGFRLNKRVIDIDDEEEKIIEPKLKKNQCTTVRLFLNYEPEEKIMSQVFEKKKNFKSKGLTNTDPIDID